MFAIISKMMMMRDHVRAGLIKLMGAMIKPHGNLLPGTPNKNYKRRLKRWLHGSKNLFLQRTHMMVHNLP